ncbi:hypothetical protein SO802_000495 [Lithocarpus litseifolius]|uniref:Uncharacterized protein n=1 Tax=Lithocarpus litseifolius TaxID=425828 RepID=A0AAW2DWX4_9ROSI
MKLEIEAVDKLFCPSSQMFVLQYEEEELLMWKVVSESGITDSEKKQDDHYSNGHKSNGHFGSKELETMSFPLNEKRHHFTRVCLVKIPGDVVLRHSSLLNKSGITLELLCSFATQFGGQNFKNDRPICQIYGKVGHQALDCYHRMDFAYQGKNPPTKLAAMASAFNATLTNNQDPWLADSGTSDHLTANLSNLSVLFI